MATEQKAATEDVKMDLFEDDDEFEEFEINEGKIVFAVLIYIYSCQKDVLNSMVCQFIGIQFQFEKNIYTGINTDDDGQNLLNFEF